MEDRKDLDKNKEEEMPRTSDDQNELEKRDEEINQSSEEKKE